MNTKNDINWWQQKAEELKLQLHLGKKEAAEAFEKQKKEMAAWAADMRYKLERSEQQQSQRLRQKLEELELQAALGKAEGIEALKAQQANLQAALHKVEQEVNAYAKKADSTFDEFAEKAGNTLEHWRMQAELLHLQMHLGAKEAGEELESFRKNVRGKVDALEDKLQKARDEGEAGWNRLKGEIEHTWKDVKGLFSKAEG